jgi:predicted ATP-dependent serine protease
MAHPPPQPSPPWSSTYVPSVPQFTGGDGAATAGIEQLTPAFSQPTPAPLEEQSPRTTVNAPGRPKLQDAATFLQEHANPRVRWTLDRLLPETGIAMIAGAPFCGKTALSVCVAVAAHDLGRELAGRRVLGGDVLYVKLEHESSAFANLVRRAQVGLGVPSLSHISILQELALDDDDSLEYLKACADHVQADVIIIDSLRRASRLDENSSQDAAEIIRRLHELTKDGTRLVIVLHHLAKGTIESPRGSGDFLAGVDTFVSMTKSGDDVKLRAIHHSGGENELTVRFDFSDDGLRLTASAAPSTAQDAEGRLHQVDQAILFCCAQQAQTSVALRLAVRSLLRQRSIEGIGNETIDARVDCLVAAARLRDFGSGNRHQWRAI